MTRAPHPQASGAIESQALFAMAVERINRNNYLKALSLLVEALRITPGNPEYLSYFGLCIAQTDRDYERAVRYCRQAVRALPSNPAMWLNLGRVYRMQGDNAIAYDTLQRAWQVRKNHPGVAVELARMGIRRPSFFTFLPRGHWLNRHLGRLRAWLERRLLGRRQS